MKEQKPKSATCYECGQTYTKGDGVEMYEHSRTIKGEIIYLCELCREEVEER